MTLTPANYHSPEARAAYISASDVKLARRCESLWLAQDLGLYQAPDTEAFAYGRLFEAALTGQGEDFIQLHPELTLTRGSHKGMLRAAYADALALAQAVRRSPFLATLIDRCRKQVIFTGTLGGIPARAMADLVDEDGSIYDIKSTRSFRPVWDDTAGAYLDWWDLYHYPIQLWVYRELARQNGLTVPQVGLIAGDKSNLDVEALVFGPNILEAARADAEYTLARMAAIRLGDQPEACGRCPWCLAQKRITAFQEVD